MITKHDNKFNLLQLFTHSFEFYSKCGWSKAQTYKYLKDNILRYKNVKYIQNLKHGARVHYK